MNKKLITKQITAAVYLVISTGVDAQSATDAVLSNLDDYWANDYHDEATLSLVLDSIVQMNTIYYN